MTFFFVSPLTLRDALSPVFANMRYQFSHPLFCQVLCGALIALIVPLAFAADSLPEIQRLIGKGQYPQALEKADAYLVSRPKDFEARFLKGVALTEMNRTDEAVAVFSRLTEERPDLPEPYNNLAVLYARQKQYDQARTALEKAIRTHPAYKVAYENLGDVYATLAGQAYDKALQLDFANTKTQSKLSLIRDLNGLSSRATAALTPSGVPTQNPPVQPTPPTQPPTPSKPPVVAMPPTAVSPTAGTASVPGGVSSSSVSSPSSTPADNAAGRQALADPEQDISKMLAAWALAWSRQDVKAYLGFYAPTFKPPKNLSRKDWEAERKERISSPEWIKVTYDQLKVSVNGEKATANFRQHYRASGFKGDLSKTFTLVRSGNRWFIAAEEVR